VYVPWYLTHWHFAPPLFPIARVLGAALIVAGLPILLDSFARFALQGLGTPAPVMPPKRLVVSGLYRYVRNPMYVAVTALIAGQGLLFGSVTVLEYSRSCGPDSSCSLSPTKSLRCASSSATSTSATGRT
jgi:protein-S-isoprenylcysteine O-methyltransferase Ste14